MSDTGGHSGREFGSFHHSILAAAVWPGCYNLAAATQASQGVVAAVVTAAVMAWAVVLVALEVKANRHGASILAAGDDRGSGARSRTHQP